MRLYSGLLLMDPFTCALGVAPLHCTITNALWSGGNFQDVTKIGYSASNYTMVQNSSTMRGETRQDTQQND